MERRFVFAEGDGKYRNARMIAALPLLISTMQRVEAALDDEEHQNGLLLKAVIDTLSRVR